MGFSNDLRRKAADIWDTEHRHPFVTGIGDGSLDMDKFRYYMRQDYVFLIDYCRVLALAVAKAPDVDDMGWFAMLLHETLNTEMALHTGFCEEFGIAKEQLESTQPSPATAAYTRHMLQTAFNGGIGEIATVILPCAWGYAEIGKMLQDRGVPAAQPLYARWIEMYSSAEFAALADWLRSFVDRIALGCGAEERARMERAFIASSRYEYMFWDAAWRQEDWPV